ncbi:MAG TPA: ADOP family duplicated permease [Longimicrobiales bacterium]|nr:ADOP family duplicated permease [Longimicrobiales bacterium]
MRRVALALYRACARLLLPPAFRREYGAELEQTVASRLHGALGALDLWTRVGGELADLAGTAAREWRATLTATGEVTMRGGWAELGASVRSLARRPGPTLGVVLTIGIGIGATTTILGVVDGVVLRPLPYEDPERLVAIGALLGSQPPDPATGLQRLVDMSSEVFERYHERARSFSRLAALDPFALLLSDGSGSEEEVPAALVSPELFDLVGVSPVLGRAFAPEEYGISSDGVAMISYELWQSRYGGDPGVLGRTLPTTPESGPSRVIVGILPRGFRLPEAFAAGSAAPQVYVPLPLANIPPGVFLFYDVVGIGRFAPGVTLEQARDEAEQLFAEIQLEIADLPVPPSGRAPGIGVNDLHAETVGETGRTLWAFLGAAALLLLLTALNAATLFLSRALDRTQELGVRVALGAGRGGVVRLLVGEAAVLSVAGGVLGVALAHGGVAAFLRYAPPTIPRLSSVAVDGRVLAVALVTTLATALAAGLLPALRFTARAPWERLKGGGRGASDAASRLRTILVGAQLALAVVLLSGAGLLFSSFMRLRSMDPGFEPDGLVVVESASRGLRGEGGPSTAMMAQSWDAAREALAAVPGVAGVAQVNVLLFQSPTWAPRLLLPGDGPEVVREGIAGYVIAPGSLEAMGTEIVEGRGLEPSDGPDGEPVLLVNEAFVRTQMNGESPLGTTITRAREGLRESGQLVTMRVVGVVEDVVQARAEDGPRPAVYLPYGQVEPPQLGSFWTGVRTDPSAESLASALSEAFAATGRAPRTIAGMESLMSGTRATPRFRTLLIGAFAAVAMVLAAAGLHGTLAHSVRRRQRELGVRMALGADRASVLRLVLRQGLAVSLAGLALGILGTLALSRALAAFLYDVAPYDPLTLLAVATVLILVSALACLLPARRATAVDPVRVLQAE